MVWSHVWQIWEQRHLRRHHGSGMTRPCLTRKRTKDNRGTWSYVRWHRVTVQRRWKAGMHGVRKHAVGRFGCKPHKGSHPYASNPDPCRSTYLFSIWGDCLEPDPCFPDISMSGNAHFLWTFTEILTPLCLIFDYGSIQISEGKNVGNILHSLFLYPWQTSHINHARFPEFRFKLRILLNPELQLVPANDTQD